MKVNKKQKPRNGNGKAPALTPRKRRVQNGASRNSNPQRSVAAAYATGNSGKAPQVTATHDQCRVVHRELLSNVSGTASAAFTVGNTFALNPGLAATFPWLSNMAMNWETYHFSKLRFCYYTRTGANTAGSVIMAPDYDASDAAPANEQTVSSYEDVQEDAPWKDISCSLRQGPMHSMGPKKFIRTGALAVNQDIKTYDVGNFFICTVDSAAAAPWGKVWIEYDVTFYTPQLQAVGSSFSSVGTLTNNAGHSAANIFGTVGSQVVQGGLLVAGAANVLTVTGATIGAEYLIGCNIQGNTITAFTDGGALVGATVKTGFFDGFNAAGNSGQAWSSFLATATVFTVTYTCTAVSVSAVRLGVSQVPSGDAAF